MWGKGGPQIAATQNSMLAGLGASTWRAASPDLDPSAEMETVLATRITSKQNYRNQMLLVDLLRSDMGEIALHPPMLEELCEVRARASGPAH